MLRKLEIFAIGVLVGSVVESVLRNVLEQWETTPPLWMGERTCDYQFPHSGRCGRPLDGHTHAL